MPRGDQNSSIHIDQNNLNALKSFTYYVPSFSKCDTSKIQGFSLKDKFFTNQTAYNLFTAGQKIQEGLCGKYSCGTVHAYTRVPPIGVSKGVEESVDGIKDNPLPICGNATITFRLFPTQNTQVRANLTFDSAVTFLTGEHGKFAINSTCLPSFELSKAVGALGTNSSFNTGGIANRLAIWSVPQGGWFSTNIWGRGAKDFTPATADVTLPEIWGNWTNAHFNETGKPGEENWTGGFVGSVTASSNAVAAALRAVLGLFIDVNDYKPNLAIWHIKKATKQGKDRV